MHLLQLEAHGETEEAWEQIICDHQEWQGPATESWGVVESGSRVEFFLSFLVVVWLDERYLLLLSCLCVYVWRWNCFSSPCIRSSFLFTLSTRFVTEANCLLSCLALLFSHTHTHPKHIHTHTGVEYWGLLNPKWSHCNRGRRQSPVDINPDSLLYDPGLGDIHVNGDQVWTGDQLLLLYKFSSLSVYSSPHPETKNQSNIWPSDHWSTGKHGSGFEVQSGNIIFLICGTSIRICKQSQWCATWFKIVIESESFSTLTLIIILFIVGHIFGKICQPFLQCIDQYFRWSTFVWIHTAWHVVPLRSNGWCWIRTHDQWNRFCSWVAALFLQSSIVQFVGRINESTKRPGSDLCGHTVDSQQWMEQ